MDGFWSRVYVSGFLVLSLLITSGTCIYMCPMCTCPAFYKPVCSYRLGKTETGNKPIYRTFPQPCELSCQNKCLSEKFSFLHNGRCSSRESTNLVNRWKGTTLRTRKLPMNG